MKTLVLRGKRFWLGEVRQGDEMGGCEAPWMPEREIDIPVGGKTCDELDTIIHECLHGCFWDMDEDAVSESATSIARVLWRLGWRKT